jgi:hypothetical protein
MIEILTDRDNEVGPWVCERSEGLWYPGRGRTIGVAKSGILRGGVIYDDFNGASIAMHVASDGSRRWMTRNFLWFLFAFPFLDLKCRVAVATLPASRIEAIFYARHLGFIQTAVIQDGHPTGDLLIHTMRREHCPWIHIKPRV